MLTSRLPLHKTLDFCHTHSFLGVMITAMNDDTSSTLSSVERKIHAIKNTLPKPTLEPTDDDSSETLNETLLLLDNTSENENISEPSHMRKVVEDPTVPQDNTQNNTELALKVDVAKEVAQDHSLQLVTHELEASESTSDDGIKAAINEGLAAANQQVLQAQEAIQEQLQPADDSKAALENIATKTTMLQQMLGSDADLVAEVDDTIVVALEQEAQQKDALDEALWTDRLPLKEKLEAELLQQLPEAAETKSLDYIQQHKQLEDAQFKDMPLEKDMSLEEDISEQENYHVGSQLRDAKVDEEITAVSISNTDRSDTNLMAHTLDDGEMAGQLLLEENESMSQSDMSSSDMSQSEVSDKSVRQDNPIFHWMISPITRARKRRAEKERLVQEEREVAKQAAQAALEQAQREQAQREQKEAGILAQQDSDKPDSDKQAETERSQEQADPLGIDNVDIQNVTVGQSVDKGQSTDVLTDALTDRSEQPLLEQKADSANTLINPLSHNLNEISEPSAEKKREEDSEEDIEKDIEKEVSESESSEGKLAEAEETVQDSKAEAKEIADAVEASSVDNSSEAEEVLEPQEAIAGDEAAQLEAEGISEENPELKQNESTLQWWGDYQMDVNEMGLWQIGPTSVEIHRLEHEWRIITETGENPLDSTMEVFYPLPSSHPSLESKMRRYMFHKSTGIVNLRPNLADRAIIVKPETPFEVRNGEQITMYVSTPIWVRITTPGTPKPLRSIASFRSPDIWYGEDTRTGELCYYSKLLGQLTLEGVQRRPYRAVTPMVLQNRSKEPLLIERIRLPMRYLNLYAAKDNFLWTSKLYLIQRRNNHTRIRVDRGAPQEMGEHHLVAHAELKMPRYLRMSAFSRFNFARGGDV